MEKIKMLEIIKTEYKPEEGYAAVTVPTHQWPNLMWLVKGRVGNFGPGEDVLDHFLKLELPIPGVQINLPNEYDGHPHPKNNYGLNGDYISDHIKVSKLNGEFTVELKVDPNNGRLKTLEQLASGLKMKPTAT